MQPSTPRVSCSGVLTPSQLANFRTAVGDDALITATTQLQTYECDGLTNFRVVPDAVVLPRDGEQVQAMVRSARATRFPLSAAARARA